MEEIKLLLIITIGISSVLLLFVMGLFIRVIILGKTISNNKLKLKEFIISDKERLDLEISINNLSYIDNQINEIGILYNNNKLVLDSENKQILSRSNYIQIDNINFIIEKLGLDSKKAGKIKIYFTDLVGTIHKISAKKLKRIINTILKERFIENKKLLKDERYKTGSYNACDRFVIIMSKIVYPFTALHNKISKSINKRIKDKQAIKEVYKERQEIFDEQEKLKQENDRLMKQNELRKKLQIEEKREELNKQKSKLNNITIIKEEEENIIDEVIIETTDIE